MIYEMRTYTLQAGKVPEMLKHASEISVKVRGDNYGKLEGYWFSEFGALNQVWHLWSYTDLNERARLRAELGKNKDWTTLYIPVIRPLLLRQENRILNMELPLKKPEREGNIYEYRYYQVQPGRQKDWLDLFRGAMPVREKYSRNIGVWSNEGGSLNEVSHLWAYPDFNARMAARSESGKDPEWQAFVKAGGPLLVTMNSVALIPAPHSPLK